MARIERHIKKRALEKASQSPCRFKIAALGFNAKGELVEAKTNSYGRQSTPYNGLHAEARILKNVHKKGIVKIIICRIGRKNNILPIDPCRVCRKIATKYNVKIISIKSYG